MFLTYIDNPDKINNIIQDYYVDEQEQESSVSGNSGTVINNDKNNDDAIDYDGNQDYEDYNSFMFNYGDDDDEDDDGGKKDTVRMEILTDEILETMEMK